jgi:predicted phosphodiesterase
LKRIVVLSDMQMPYHDKRALRNVINFVGTYQPDAVVSVGDEVDFPQISRWNRGMAGEYKGDLQAHCDTFERAFAMPLRKVFAGPVDVSRSNHMDRPLTYVRTRAPGLMGLKALEVPSLLNFEKYGITYHEEPHEIAPGWLLAHGDEGGSSRAPGGTALALARKWGYSVVCGHTHKLGIQHEHMGVNSKLVKERFGFEVGNLMAMKGASYLKAGHANWQQGFGILYVEKNRVTPCPIFVRANGTFVVEGKTYGQ